MVFLRQPESISCLRAGDTDDNGRLDISDAIALLRHLFMADPAPAALFPDCGRDPPADDLDGSASACP
jgi:hypothetical protein